MKVADGVSPDGSLRRTMDRVAEKFMGDGLTSTRKADGEVLISVLIPLEFHRDQATVAIRKWRTEQTLPAAAFELILVASNDADERELDEIRGLLAPHDTLLQTSAKHDVAQVAEAARHAKAEFLFFTESHVWPSPTVLQQCLDTFAEHPDWVGFSCRTTANTPNRLARAEARMYQADIDYGMTQHPWRKILDQCFATRRAPYERAGGLDPTLGHFSEWELAARYYSLRLDIGYAPEIELEHCYIGQWSELREFTEDFVAGEATWLARGGPSEGLPIDIPAEWYSRGERRRDLARRSLQMAWRHHRRHLQPPLTRAAVASALCRYGSTAAAGGTVAVRLAGAAAAWRSLALMAARAFGSEKQLDRAFQNAIVALSHHGRLKSAASSRPASGDLLWTPGDDSAHLASGFHAPEVFGGSPFRWSADLAAVELQLPPGEHLVRVETLRRRLTTSGEPAAFYLDGRPLAGDDVKIEDGDYVLRVAAGMTAPILGWVSDCQAASNDTRNLGLPVARISRMPEQIP